MSMWWAYQRRVLYHKLTSSWVNVLPTVKSFCCLFSDNIFFEPWNIVVWQEEKQKQVDLLMTCLADHPIYNLRQYFVGWFLIELIQSQIQWLGQATNSVWLFWWLSLVPLIHYQRSKFSFLVEYKSFPPCNDFESIRFQVGRSVVCE